MSNYQGKFRSNSRRLQSWDYSAAGGYFVTICTKGHKSTFGKIEDDVIQLSPCGIIVAKEWQISGDLRENVTLDEWVIMPNHFHGIIILSNLVETSRRGVSTNETIGNLENGGKSEVPT